jgi:hypothetical protein
VVDGGGVPLLRARVLRANRHHRGAGALRWPHVGPHPGAHVPQPRRPRGPSQVRHREGPQARRYGPSARPPWSRAPGGVQAFREYFILQFQNVPCLVACARWLIQMGGPGWSGFVAVLLPGLACHFVQQLPGVGSALTLGIRYS